MWIPTICKCKVYSGIYDASKSVFCMKYKPWAEQVYSKPCRFAAV